MTHDKETFSEIDDLVIIDTGLLGKLVYKITNDFLHIKLENIFNGFEYEKIFSNLDELDSFIEDSPSIQLVPLH